jgi:ABC-type transport system involved in multi-copper enzyme maturation permease subunit
MLKTVIKKEILANIFSFRFLVTFVLLLGIVSFTTFILTDDYLRRLDEYSLRQKEVEGYLGKYAHFNRIGPVINPSQPPLAFYSLIRGLSSDTNINNFDNDPLPVMFPLIDLVFIVTILLSLVALLFSYDSISGEKEDGTLKLMLSNKLSRSKMILGKIIGGSLTLLIPFVFSLLIGLLIIIINPRVNWKGADWGALALIFLASAIYFTLFYCLGVLISSRHHTSSSSIMTSLFIWVLLILIIPNLSPYVASFLAKTPSRIKVNREEYRLSDVERDELGRKLSQERRLEMYKKYPSLAEVENLSEAEIKRKIARDSGFKKAYQELTEAIENAWHEANRIQGEKVDLIERDLVRKQAAQQKLSIYISMVSPLSDFTYLATDLSSTGIRSRVHFDRIAANWWRAFAEYEAKKQAMLKEKDPTIDIWNTPVDVSDRPKFQYQQEALLDRFNGTIRFFVILLIFNLVFFTAAFFSFIKYDVR